MPGWAQGELTRIAFCWRLARRDGVTLGFTSADRDLAIDGLLYAARPGMAPSAISLSDGFEIDTQDISGALSDAAIREDDLAAGRWDGARLWLYAVNAEHSDDAPMLLIRGALGNVAQADGGFTAELRGPTALLDRPVAELVSPGCRARLGDKRCGVDMIDRRMLARVIAVIDAVTIRIDRSEPVLNGWAQGQIDWISGANSGLATPVAASVGDGLMLADVPHFAVAVGDRLRIGEGCDRQFATCRDRFANAANFRGEPHVPGQDLLTRYGQL